MGLGNNNGRFAYVNIKKGKLAIKKDNEISYFDYIEGTVSGIDIRDEEYQGQKYKKLCVNLNDGNEDFQLQLRLDSGYGRAFCNIIPNVDLSLRIKITPTYQEVDGKGKSGMFINQAGKALKWFYTKDNPNGLPPMEKVYFKNQEHWDNTKQVEFYIDLLLNKIKPKLNPASSIMDGPAHMLGEKIPEAHEVTEPIDDLPF